MRKGRDKGIPPDNRCSSETPTERKIERLAYVPCIPLMRTPLLLHNMEDQAMFRFRVPKEKVKFVSLKLIRIYPDRCEERVHEAGSR